MIPRLSSTQQPPAAQIAGIRLISRQPRPKFDHAESVRPRRTTNAARAASPGFADEAASVVLADFFVLEPIPPRRREHSIDLISVRANIGSTTPCFRHYRRFDDIHASTLRLGNYNSVATNASGEPAA
jgi:hypothetical protein